MPRAILFMVRNILRAKQTVIMSVPVFTARKMHKCRMMFYVAIFRNMIAMGGTLNPRTIIFQGMVGRVPASPTQP